jgi:hypothetical protein
MNFPGFITIKDFFNYYVAGFVWLVDIGLFIFPWTNSVKLINVLEKTQKISINFGEILIGLALLVFPYLIGFVATPINMGITKLIRSIFGDPQKWITDYEEKSKWKLYLHKGKRLSRTNIRLIIQKLKKIYGDEKEINGPNISKWFFQIRAIVINQKGEAGALAIRAQDLSNFTESILLPFPLLLLVLGWKTIDISHSHSIILLGLGGLSFVFLTYRYLHLRTYWVKHVYRAFLANQHETVEKE